MLLSYLFLTVSDIITCVKGSHIDAMWCDILVHLFLEQLLSVIS